MYIPHLHTQVHTQTQKITLCHPITMSRSHNQLGLTSSLSFFMCVCMHACIQVVHICVIFIQSYYLSNISLVKHQYIRCYSADSGWNDAQTDHPQGVQRRHL